MVTVAELIAALQKLPQDANVYIDHTDRTNGVSEAVLPIYSTRIPLDIRLGVATKFTNGVVL